MSTWAKSPHLHLAGGGICNTGRAQALQGLGCAGSRWEEPGGPRATLSLSVFFFHFFHVFLIRIFLACFWPTLKWKKTVPSLLVVVLVYPFLTQEWVASLTIQMDKNWINRPTKWIQLDDSPTGQMHQLCPKWIHLPRIVSFRGVYSKCAVCAKKAKKQGSMNKLSILVGRNQRTYILHLHAFLLDQSCSDMKETRRSTVLSSRSC